MCLLAQRVNFRFSRFSARRSAASVHSRRKTVILTVQWKESRKVFAGKSRTGGKERIEECTERRGELY